MCALFDVMETNPDVGTGDFRRLTVNYGVSMRYLQPAAEGALFLILGSCCARAGRCRGPDTLKLRLDAASSELRRFRAWLWGSALQGSFQGLRVGGGEGDRRAAASLGRSGMMRATLKQKNSRLLAGSLHLTTAQTGRR